MISFRNAICFVLTFLLTTSSLAQVTVVQEQSQDKNYVLNGGFENSKSNWVAYKNTAQVLPVTGQGGSPTSTITATTSSPIAGKSSGLFTKPASNVQGEGFAQSFTLDSAARGRVLTISGLYQIISGTYSGGSTGVDSDVEVYIYDVDAAQVIQPAGYKLDGGVSGLNYQVNATFQTNLTSANYRLIFQVASTSSLAYTLKFDSIKIGVPNKANGPPVTDWTSYTPTGSWTTNASYSGKFRRVGDTMEIQAQVNLSGAPNAATLTITYPSGYTVDSSKLPSGTNDAGSTVIGTGGSLRTASSNQLLFPRYNNAPGNFSCFGQKVDGIYELDYAVSATTPVTWGNGDVLYFNLTIPILGWSSNLTMSDSADTRVISFAGSGQATGATGASHTVALSTIENDNTAGWNAGSSYWVVPVPGFYKITAGTAVNTGSTASVSQYSGTSIAINGAVKRSSYSYVQSTVSQTWYSTVQYEAQLSAGTQISLINDTNITAPSLITTSPSTYMQITRVSGPSQIAATESVNASYTSTNGAAIGTSYSALAFNVKNYDSHGAYNPSTGSYTCPVSGKYEVSSIITTASVTLTTAQQIEVAVYKNSAFYAELGLVQGNGTAAAYRVSGAPVQVQCNAGDVLQLQTNASVATSAYTVQGFSHLEFKRIGN